MTLTELIERLEKADAGSADLDREIAQTILGWTEYERGYGTGWRTSDDTPKTWHEIPRTTRSLDAALTLVPEGWTPNILLPPGMRAEVRLFRHAIGLNVHDAIKLDIVAEAATGPLAACIAFLKARAGKDTA